MVDFMTDPRKAPFGAVLLADVVLATDIDPDYPDATDGDFHLIRRHFDIRAFGVNGITGDAGDEMVEPHHERDDEPNLTDGHEELFAVMSGHAVFTVDGEDLDAPAGTLVFVRDPDLDPKRQGDRRRHSDPRDRRPPWSAVRDLPMGTRSPLTSWSRRTRWRA